MENIFTASLLDVWQMIYRAEWNFHFSTNFIMWKKLQFFFFVSSTDQNWYFLSTDLNWLFWFKMKISLWQFFFLRIITIFLFFPFIEKKTLKSLCWVSIEKISLVEKFSDSKLNPFDWLDEIKSDLMKHKFLL